MGVSQLGGASNTRLVTKQNATGEAVIGTVALTGNTGTTSWGQITSSLGADTLITSMQVGSGADSPQAIQLNYVEVGRGGAGSETSVAAIPIARSNDTSTIFSFVLAPAVPVRIAAGQRVAVRITTPSAMNSATINVSLFGVPYANVEGN